MNLACKIKIFIYYLFIIYNKVFVLTLEVLSMYLIVLVTI